LLFKGHVCDELSSERCDRLCASLEGMPRAERQYVASRINRHAAALCTAAPAAVDITVHFADGRSAELSVPTNEAMSSVKQRITATVGVPEIWQNLFVLGQDQAILDAAIVGERCPIDLQGCCTLFCLLTQAISEGSWNISGLASERKNPPKLHKPSKIDRSCVAMRARRRRDEERAAAVARVGSVSFAVRQRSERQQSRQPASTPREM
jgi:hypothetical protein